jgi:hypothetical protein
MNTFINNLLTFVNGLVTKLLDTKGMAPLTRLADALLSKFVRQESAAARCFFRYGPCRFNFYYRAFVRPARRCCLTWFGPRCGPIRYYYC